MCKTHRVRRPAAKPRPSDRFARLAFWPNVAHAPPPRLFFSPVLDGGFPLFELFNSRWRSSRAIRAFKVAISAACAAISARSALVGSGRITIFESLNRKLPPPYLPSRCV
jgi:hypothetical protein